MKRRTCEFKERSGKVSTEELTSKSQTTIVIEVNTCH